MDNNITLPILEWGLRVKCQFIRPKPRIILISFLSSAFFIIPSFLKQSTYYIFSLNIRILFFNIKLLAMLKTRSGGAEAAGIV